MPKRAAILATVVVGAAMLSAIDAHAFRGGFGHGFRGGTFGHFTPIRPPAATVFRDGRMHHESRFPNPPLNNLCYTSFVLSSWCVREGGFCDVLPRVFPNGCYCTLCPTLRH